MAEEPASAPPAPVKAAVTQPAPTPVKSRLTFAFPAFTAKQALLGPAAVPPPKEGEVDSPTAKEILFAVLNYKGATLGVPPPAE